MASEIEAPDLSSKPLEFLCAVLGRSDEEQPGTKSLSALVSPDPSRPYVTLTFAQSLDAKIAGRAGLQLILSGDESMKMTHWMRTMHDGILIGIGTALNDNPQLNVRHLPFPKQGGHLEYYHHPRPLILDPHLRLSPKCKLIKNASLKAGVMPWVISARPYPDVVQVEGQDRVADWESRKAAIEDAGAKILLVDVELPASSRTSSYLPIKAVLEAIRAEGIQSVMVEGGARIILSFLSAATQDELVDSLIVTVAPVIVGAHGVGYSELLDDIPALQHVRTEALGKDVVMGMKVVKSILQNKATGQHYD
ncbi:unnamed protein product [Peniophora sp. CBMAI 1063]|nr:unnamed protein product [Peniophora sp. CBMAI 1063]